MLEQQESRVLLELRALHEGSWKLGEFTAFSSKLVMRISPELKALLKVSNKAHPELQALLIDLMQYKPKFLIGGKAVAPLELGMEDPPHYLPPPDPPIEDQVDAMAKAEEALRQPIHLPAKARFSKGPAIHVQFDGGAQDGHGTGGFVILDDGGKEVVRAGRYYGPGRTNNEAEAFAMRDAMQCLAKLRRSRPALGKPVRVFGDSQLMIRFITRLYKRPTRQSIYWALEDVRRAEATLK